MRQVISDKVIPCNQVGSKTSPIQPRELIPRSLLLKAIQELIRIVPDRAVNMKMLTNAPIIIPYFMEFAIDETAIELRNHLAQMLLDATFIHRRGGYPLAGMSVARNCRRPTSNLLKWVEKVPALTAIDLDQIFSWCNPLRVESGMGIIVAWGYNAYVDGIFTPHVVTGDWLKSVLKFNDELHVVDLMS